MCEPYLILIYNGARTIARLRDEEGLTGNTHHSKDYDIIGVETRMLPPGDHFKRRSSYFSTKTDTIKDHNINLAAHVPESADNH
ncbi:hypothetical protein J6590_022904 [Homalodisca vitripennis]|nr:hypothetical protein J6590_022904 [Homalodisca vitripennis]